ncbi:non-ribosomal peptide synthetase [Bradyrhizobium sp. 21]|uniref:non-ribosomal peptide synthetase n=1 Tax=Bradyrhizobium sp. 21 TaxID=2782666 RepID=UPI001FFC0D76|nr:non-ribosomal peptide synthetase [Bradyrhizobium sp. 21]MCK1387661.1 amino acid adenylation domain-containing protein [Bradyrhizobium sp. 21]
MSDLQERLGKLSPERRTRFLSSLLGQPASPDDALPRASILQEQLWFVDEASAGRARNNLAMQIRLCGPVEAGRLVAALRSVLRAFPVLTSRFRPLDERLVLESALDLEAFTIPDHRLDAEAALITNDPTVKALVETSFDLNNGPLFRVRLLHLPGGARSLLWVAHHSVWDGISHSLFLRHLVDALEGRFAASPAMPGYTDFALRQRQLVREERERHVAYWRARLHGHAELDLPLDYPRPMVPEFDGARRRRLLPQSLRSRIRDLCRQFKCSPYAIYLSAIYVLLLRYTGQRDLIVGGSVDCRSPEFQNSLGLFVNMLPLRQMLPDDATFSVLVDQVRASLASDLAHKDLPFAELVTAINPPRVSGRAPIFQVECTYEAREFEAIECDGLRLEPEVLHDAGARFDLAFVIEDSPEQLAVNAEYACALFDRSTVDRMLANYETLLRNVAEQPECIIDEIPLISPGEQAILAAWGRGPAIPSTEESLIDRFNDRAHDLPEKTAVVDASSSVTFRELDELSDRIACALRARDVRGNDCVALAVRRSVEMVAAVLGVLKAGAAFVPIDPGAPERRIRSIVESCSAKALLVSDALRSRLPLGLDRQMISIEDALQAPISGERLQSAQPAPDSLAYVIYTSGSTGEPKGVMIEHRSVINCIDGIRSAYELTSDERVMHFASLSFDVGVFDMFVALLAGCTLFIASDEDRLDPEALEGVIARHEITFAELPAALMPLMRPNRLPNLRVVSTGGEKFGRELVDSWQSNGRRFFNGYGPTECTIAMILSECTAGDVRLPAIGRPIQNHTVHVRDGRGNLVPVGVAGELYVEGVGLARGYINDEELTREKFVSRNDGAGGTTTAYRTGDTVRWRFDGQLEFLGRRDAQVKLNGFRIEISEVERAFTSFEGILQCAVFLLEDETGKWLRAYVAPAGERLASVPGLRTHLTQLLPGYMIPREIFQIEKMPLNHSGKVDRNVLLDMESVRLGSDHIVEPETPLEKEIAAKIFAPVFAGRQIGLNDNFFEAGGGSLQAAQLVARIRTRFECRMSIAEFFKAPTIAGIAEFVARQQRTASGADQESLLAGLDSSGDGAGPIGSELRVWRHALIYPDGEIYNIPIALRIRGQLDAERLQSTMTALAQRHDALRSYFVQSDDPKRVVLNDWAPELQVVDWQDEGHSAAELSKFVAARASGPFNLSLPEPPWRASLVRVASEEHLLVIALHHLIFDGWSVGVFVRDLLDLYDSSPRPLKTSERWRSELQSAADLSFWRDRLKGGPPPLIWKAAADRKNGSGEGTAAITLDLPVVEELRQVCAARGVTPYMWLLTCFACAMKRFVRNEAFVVGVPIANRVDENLEDAIGCFANAVPILLEPERDSSFGRWLEIVRREVGESLAHSTGPIDRLIDDHREVTPPGRAPVFQAMFAVQNTPEMRATGQSLSVTRYRDHLKWPMLPIRAFYSPLPEMLDISLVGELRDGSFVGLLEYELGLLDRAVALDLLRTFEAITRGTIENPAARIDSLGSHPV